MLLLLCGSAWPSSEPSSECWHVILAKLVETAAMNAPPNANPAVVQRMMYDMAHLMTTLKPPEGGGADDVIPFDAVIAKLCSCAPVARTCGPHHRARSAWPRTTPICVHACLAP